MKNFRIFLFLLVVTGFVFSPSLGAQEAPPVPRNESPSQGGERQSEDADSKQDEAKPADVAKPSSDQESEQGKPSGKKLADEAQAEKDAEPNSELQENDNESEMKSDGKTRPGEEKADDQQEEEKPDKKSDDKQDEDNQDDGKQDDDKQDDDKKGIAERALDKLRSIRGTPNIERVNKFSKQSDDFVRLFEPVVASVNESTLTIMAGKQPIALGTVVDSNGLVLTKASELRGSIGCKLNDGTIVEAKVIGIDPQTDLALLKVDAENLNVAQWSEEPSPLTGRWLATPKGSRDDKATIGVVSVDARKIAPSRPFIGILMGNVPNDGGVRITQVIPRSPADLADLWVNDVIVSIDSTQVKDNRSIVETLGQYDVNDRITLGILRGETEMKIRLTLAERDKVSPDNQRSNMQNSMGSILSRRRKDFPEAFEHDSMLSSKTCGGPIVDLSGKIVGINIARAGRVSSLAIPAYRVREIVEKLKTGKLAPEVVNKEEIEKINLELEEMNAKYGDLPEKKSVLERNYNVEKARMDELNQTIKDLETRMKVIEEKSKNYKSELDSVRKQILSIEKNRQRLEADREQLRTGSR